MQTENLEQKGEKRLTLKEEALDLATLQLSLLMRLVVLLWGILLLVLNLLGQMLTGKIHFLELFLIKIDTWWILFKVRLKMGKLNRQRKTSGVQSSQTMDQSST